MPRAGRAGIWIDGHGRARAPAARRSSTSRAAAQPMSVHAGGRRRARLQRRGLQLPRAARGARGRRRALHDRERHRGRPARLPAVGRRASPSASTACSRSRSGMRGAQQAGADPRPARASSRCTSTATCDGVLFGSEPKAILANPLARREVDADGLRELFAPVRTPAPRRLVRDARGRARNGRDRRRATACASAATGACRRTTVRRRRPTRRSRTCASCSTTSCAAS